MINMQSTNLTSSSVRSLVSLKQSQNCRNSLNILPISIPKRNPQVQQNPTQIITVNVDLLDKLKQILEWRQNTDFPIVKLKSYTFLQKKHDFGAIFLEILVQLESQMRKLSDMKKLPFFQAIYILKESMIGFERLCHRFGFFNITSDMIMFNENQNCKVWINKLWYSSDVEPSNVKSEKEFIFELCNTVQEKTVKSRISCDFFEKIQTCKYFFEAIGAIETFTKVNKIKIPVKLQNLSEIKTPMVRTSSTMDSNIIDTKTTNIVNSANIPRFIKKVQVKKLGSQEIYSPLPRKISMVTEICGNDRSFTNVSRNHSSNSFLKNDYSENRVEERQDVILDQENFLNNLNIRHIEPSGKVRTNDVSSSRKFSERQIINTPQIFSPLAMVSEIDLNEDKKSGFSFNKGNKKHESQFEASERMFLTVCKPTAGKGLFTPVKKPQPQYSPRCIRTLQYLDAQDIQSLEEFDQEANDKFILLTINQIKQKRKLSGDFGKSSGRLEDEESQTKVQQELYTPKYKTTNVLNVPRPSQNNLKIAKSPSQDLLCQNRKYRQDFELQEEEKEQQEREFLRQNIMGANGWKNLSILKDRKPIQQSIIKENEDVLVLNRAKTSQLPKLGVMGREIKTSRIDDIEFELEYGSQIEKEKYVRDDFMSLLD